MTLDSPQILDDFKLGATFHNNLTIHSREKQEQLWARIKLIGTGAFGDVWLEKKVDHPLAVGDEEEIERVADVDLRAVKRIRCTGKSLDWSRELKILAHLKNNPSFVDFIGWYDDRSDYVYFAMEYMRHGDLSQYLKKAGPEVKAQAKTMVKQILTGLIALHEQNICHRDIKSKNILVASISPIQIKIADFGLSKHESGSSLHTACGTTHYLAPELQGFVRPSKNRRSYTNLVDIWSLGIVTHEILTGELPFLQESPDDCSDSDSESGIEIDSQFEQLEPEYPEMDMALFANYCSGHAAFPRGPLEAAGISSLGMDFVEAVLVANPRSRISAENAMGHPWLLDPTPEPYISAENVDKIATAEETSTSDSDGESNGAKVIEDEPSFAQTDIMLHRGSSLFRKQYAARERFNRFGINRSGFMQQRYARERRYIDSY